ncbi:cell division FtsA domain-containing protein [Lentibacillus saliphilus]|uniref:cell division FtsA domain-containing protein n=1 Tax=Lentibacillus saliphilus TaxID=2737028 RepID=UPI001C307982|nr:cell division FtsA domain-containing protein [Lentibacillus saliphilus]
MTERIFALDIGTRSVTGMLLEKHHHSYTVLDYCMKEHQVRSMLDGQIHHVVEVAAVMKDVKETLEQTHGPLKKVCVAAAGRALKTVRSTAALELNEQMIKDEDAIRHLELSAVHQAQLTLASSGKMDQSDNRHFYCVGYSVLQYYLDDEPIGSLIDQRGQVGSVDIIATFLPRIVVESLFAALERADLEMEDLTLEPIAAINVLIPTSMRRLNVALVDIGAGTSDIALTGHGTISAYGMVPMAGDEITEAISDAYLLDFPIAEATKRTIVNEGKAVVKDILGFETTITEEMLNQDIHSSIEKLASKIAEEIIHLNGQAPKAVMLVGGGSLTPSITQTLATKLQLPENRVAVRGLDAIQNIQMNVDLPTGPNFVTPIGIAISGKTNPVHYVSVYVNGEVIRMFEMKQLTVGDCLVQAGIDVQKYYGKPGMAKVITLNGSQMTLPGTYGEKPQIQLNGKDATVNDVIKSGDQIAIDAGLAGMPASATIDELIEEAPVYHVYFQDQKYTIKPTYTVNQTIQPGSYIINDKDDITLTYPRTIGAFLAHYASDTVLHKEPIVVYANHKQVMLETSGTQIWLNEKRATVDDRLHANDRIVIKEAKKPIVQDVLNKLGHSSHEVIKVTFNDEAVELQQPKIELTRDGQSIDVQTELLSQDHIKITDLQCDAFIFQDVFRYVNIDLTHKQGRFTLIKNDEPASFTDVIMNGDQLSIQWDAD